MLFGALGYLGGPGGLEKLRECVRRFTASLGRAVRRCAAFAFKVMLGPYGVPRGFGAACAGWEHAAVVRRGSSTLELLGARTVSVMDKDKEALFCASCSF